MLMRNGIWLILCLFTLDCKSWGKFWQVYSLSEPEPVYAGHSLWNDYIKNDGIAQSATVVSASLNGATGRTTRLSASGSACNATDTGGYNICLHAGMLRVATLSGKNDCSGITASDNRGVFQWLCVPSGEAVKIVAVGFNENKYMTDLIDFDTVAFRSMALTVAVDGQTFTTSSTQWYKNAVVNYSGGGLNTASTVYLVQNNPNAQILASADRTTLLTRPGVTLTVGTAVDVVFNNLRNFNWYEVTADNNNIATGAIRLDGNFVVGQNSNAINPATGANRRAIRVGVNSYVRDSRGANSNSNAAAVESDGAGTIMQNIVGTNTHHGIIFYNTDNMLVGGTFANYSGEFAMQANVVGTIVLNLHLANKNGQALTFLGTGADDRNHTFMNLATANTTGLNSAGGGGAKIQVINYASYQTGATGLTTGQDANYFSGILRVTAITACTTGGANQGVVNGTCAPQGASDFTLSTNINPTNSFVGKVATNDSKNNSDTLGLATYALANDWINFENRYRGYGLDGGAFPVLGNQGVCTAASCRIWDWNLKATDGEYRNLLAIPTGNNTAIHKWSATSQATCTQPGATWVASGLCDKPPYTETTTCVANGGTIGSGCISTFLRNAYEVLEDGIGNENGLCESNEVCIYTPNIGAYQGHGNLVSAGGFTNGTITGVTLMRYDTNGY